MNSVFFATNQREITYLTSERKTDFISSETNLTFQTHTMHEITRDSFYQEIVSRRVADVSHTLFLPLHCTIFCLPDRLGVIYKRSTAEMWRKDTFDLGMLRHNLKLKCAPICLRSLFLPLIMILTPVMACSHVFSCVLMCLRNLPYILF